MFFGGLKIQECFQSGFLSTPGSSLKGIEKIKFNVPIAGRANLLSLSLHFRDMTHGPVLACPPGPTESVINQTASPAGLGPADVGANGEAWRPSQQLMSKSSWLLQRGLDMLAWSLLETCGCVLEVFSYLGLLFQWCEQTCERGLQCGVVWYGADSREVNGPSTMKKMEGEGEIRELVVLIFRNPFDD